MEANINTQDVGAKKPSLFGMITSPGVQFERMKTNRESLGYVPFSCIVTRTSRWFICVCYVTSPEMLKMKKN